MLIGPPIPELRLFKDLTLKIKGQGHGWGQVQRHNVGLTSCRLTSLSFHANRPSHSLDTAVSKFDLKIQGQGHSSRSQSRHNTLSTHIPFVPCWSALPFLSYDFFKFWPWKSKVTVMGEVTVQSHNVGLTSCRLRTLSLYVNRPSHSLDTAGFKIWPSKSKVKVIAEGHKVGIIPYRLISPSFRVDRSSHSWDTAFSKFDLENLGSRSIDDAVAQLQVETIP